MDTKHTDEPTTVEPTTAAPTTAAPTTAEPTTVESTMAAPNADMPMASPVLVREVVWRENQKDLRADVIGALRKLERTLPTAQFYALVARYCSGSSHRAINCEDAIRRGHPELFVYHARYENDAANLFDAQKRSEGGSEDGSEDGVEGVVEGEAKWDLLVPRIVPPIHLRDQMADEWRAINCVMQNFPQSRGMAIRECMRTDTDPTALGDLSWVLSATESWTTPEWESLADWYQRQAIGLWPSVAMILRIETAKRQSHDSDM